MIFSTAEIRDRDCMGPAGKMKLEKKVAAVTGAARGIGQTLALAFAREGAAISLWDIDDDGLRQTAAEVHEFGGDALSVTTDVTRRADVVAAVEKTVARFGRIDVLVNCAALKMAFIVARERRETYHFWDIDPERWRRLLDVNITGAFLCCQEAARQMVEQKTGSIINMTTGDDTKLRRGYAPYGTSKAGLEAFTLSIAKELRPLGVRGNLLEPGGAVNLRGENDPSLLPYDIVVPAAVHLASDESRDLSGALLNAKDWRNK
jgi:NAD(P)-dependent dehydrogenase (short-subunit alcohol dehydrogenase family)